MIKTLPKEFQSTYKASPLGYSCDFLEDHRSGTNQSIITLPSLNQTPQKVFKAQANREKKEILEWIKTNNPNGISILNKCSQSKNSFSKLIALIVEELSLLSAPTRSQQIDDLERESALNSAKLEVEIQQLNEKLLKFKNEKNDINERIKKNKNRLNKLNSDVQLLQNLFEFHKISEKNNINEKKNINLKENNLEKSNPIFNENEYKRLWGERQDLLDQIENIQNELHLVQEQQIFELQEHAKKKVGKGLNLRTK